jgi:hypothetical protein
MKLQPVLVGELKIQDHQVDGLIGENTLHGAPVGREADPEVVALQVAAHDIAHGRVVIHYEDVLHHGPENRRSVCNRRFA